MDGAGWQPPRSVPINRPQWLLVVSIDIIATMAYIKADRIARQLTASGIYRPPQTIKI